MRTLQFGKITPLKNLIRQKSSNVIPNDLSSSIPTEKDEAVTVYRSLLLDESPFKGLLQSAPMEKAKATLQGDQTMISLPLPDGGFVSVAIEESPIMEDALAKKYPNIRTWRVIGSGKVVSGRIDFTEQGFHAMLTMSNGDAVYIDPAKDTNGQTYYKSYSQQANSNGNATFTCGVEGEEVSLQQSSIPRMFSAASIAKTLGSTIKTYRIAIAATGEFTEQQGGTVEAALSAINTVLNRVNEIYQRDAGVKLILVADNDKIIYTDASVDPYQADDDYLNMALNQKNLDDIIGDKNYDVGQVFSFRDKFSSSGLAWLESVCGTEIKGSSISGFMSDLDGFASDMVAHELGHQFGATHTFNSNRDFCAGNRASNDTAYEPGSGSSIMSYAGNCSDDSFSSGIPYFHAGSIKQMLDFISSDYGATCGKKMETSNQSPTADAGNNYTIPANTPFELKGSATDANLDDYLTYSWEQLNASAEGSAVDVDDGTNAIIRIFPPVKSAKRVIPNWESLYTGMPLKGELLPQKNRPASEGADPLIMALVVRDQRGGTNVDTKELTVVDTGAAFEVTSHTESSRLETGDSTTVTWNVAGTDAEPIACSTVDISLLLGDPSLGDEPQETLLASGAANDGQDDVTIPVGMAATPKARIKVKCSNNIFFAISKADLGINEDPVVVVSRTESTFSVADVSMFEGDSGTQQMIFTIVRDQADTSEVVYYTTFAETTDASDFKEVISGVYRGVDFNAGELESKVYISISGDVEEEEHETFKFVVHRLGDDGHIESESLVEATGFIIDDDKSSSTPSTLRVVDASITEGAEGTTNNMAFTATLDKTQPYPISVSYSTVDDYFSLTDSSATARTDYEKTEGVLVIPAGELSGTINVKILGDARVESDETLILSLYPSKNVTLARTDIIGTIINDDKLNNVPPVALADSVTASYRVETPIDVLASAEDADGDDLSISDFDKTSVAGGTVELSADGKQLLYTSAKGYSGEDSFNYTISDGQATASAQVTVTVSEKPNTAPVALADVATTNYEAATTINALGNDTDADGDTLSIESVDATSQEGSTVVVSGNQVTYTPKAGFSGSDRFNYVVSDGEATVSAQVTVTVGEKPNAPPVALADNAEVAYETATTINVLGNDTDMDGDTLSIESVDATSQEGGTVVVSGNQVTYTPKAGFSGSDRFNYTISDGQATASAQVTVTVGEKPTIVNPDTSTGNNATSSVRVSGSIEMPVIFLILLLMLISNNRRESKV